MGSELVIGALARIAVQVAVLAVAVWVVSRLACKAPAAWRYGLWLLVVIKFLVPPFAYYPAGLAFWERPAASAPAADITAGAVLTPRYHTMDRTPQTSPPTPLLKREGGTRVQAAFFFHPAVWLAGREIRRERELACDELVLSRSSITPKEYAAGYVSALKLANGVPTCSASLAMAEPFDMEKRRLSMILRGAVPRLSAPWLAALVLVAAIGLPTFVGCGSRNTETAEELISHVKQARKKALATVKSGKGSLVWTNREASSADDKPRESTIPITVAFSGNRFAVSLLQPTRVRDEVTFDGHTLRMTSPSSAQRPSEYTVRSGMGRSWLDHYRRIIEVGGQAYPDLDRLLQFQDGKPRIVGRQTIDGSTCVIVESVQNVQSKQGRSITIWRRLWIDPTRGYTVPKQQVRSQGGDFGAKSLTSESIIHLSRYDGVWGPAKYTHAEYRRNPMTGKPYTFLRETLVYGRDYKINVPVSDADLKPPKKSSGKELDDARTLAGLTAVEGPGVIVTLRDSPKRSPKETRPDVVENYIVHDTDVRMVINELTAAGAEAISVGGQRIVATSSITAIGPLMKVNSAEIDPPYEIRAIGNPEVLERMLKLPGGAVEPLLLLDMITIKKTENVDIPAYKGKTRFELAKPVQGSVY